MICWQNSNFNIIDGNFKNLEADGRIKEDYVMKYISYPFVISKNESKLQEGFLNMMKQIYPDHLNQYPQFLDHLNQYK